MRRRYGHGLLELLLVVTLFGVILAGLPWPRLRARPPSTSRPLPLVMQEILELVADSDAVAIPRTTPDFPVSNYQRRLNLQGVEYRFRNRQLQKRIEGRLVDEVEVDQAWFQSRYKGTRGWVVRVRLVRGNQLLLSAEVAGVRP